MTVAAIAPRAVAADAREIRPRTARDASSPPAVALLHETPGRVRIRVARIRSDPEYGRRIAAWLSSQRGIHAVRLATPTGSLTVRFDPALWDVERLLDVAARPPSRIPVEAIRHDGSETRTLIAGAAALALAAAGAPLGFTSFALALGAGPILARAVSGMVDERAVTVDALDATAIGALAAQGDVTTAAFSTTLIAGGEYIRSLTARRSRAALVSLVAHDDEPVWRVHRGREERVRLADIRRGDTIACFAGSQIPIDGRVVKGEALVDEKTLTGESMPVARSVGAQVYAATIVTDGSIHIRVQRLGSSTRAGRVVALLESAPTHDTRMTNYARRIGDRLALPTLLLGGLVWGVTGNLARAAAVVIFDFATGIRVSAPTTVLATMTKTARQDVLIKSGRALEQLAHVDTLVFDKTGTITHGAPRVVRVRSGNGHAEDDVLRLAAAAEQRVAHPAARAIVRAAEARELEIPRRGERQFRIGYGVAAEVEGTRVHVGSAQWLANEGVSVPPKLREAAEADARFAVSTVFVAADGVPIGSIGYADPPRDEAPRVIEGLRQRGIEVVMLTGDSATVARAVGAQVGIERIEAEAFPDRKAELVRELQSAGRTVGVIGDGINDSPALAYADVSLAVLEGTDLARETADVVLHDGLDGVIVAVDSAREADRLLRQNLALSLVPNATGLALATAGLIGPAVSTAINNGSAIAAGLNGVRPLFAPRAPGR